MSCPVSLWNCRRYYNKKITQIYADDSVILEGSNTKNSHECNINLSFDAFNQICGIRNLHINPEKSKAMIFGRFNMSKRRPIFKLIGTLISVNDNVTLMGFVLDGRFSWIDHLDMVRNKIQCLTIIMTIIHNYKGPLPRRWLAYRVLEAMVFNSYFKTDIIRERGVVQWPQDSSTEVSQIVPAAGTFVHY